MGKIENWNSIIGLISSIITIVGISLITIFSSLWGKLPSQMGNELENQLYSLRLGQNYVFVKEILGTPNSVQSKEYFDFNNESNTGKEVLYVKNDLIIISYFDNQDNLFGYVVINNNKHCNPKIPMTSQRGKINLQRIGNVNFSDIIISNPYNLDEIEKPELNYISFFARSGSNYIPEYYCEIYDTKGMGFLGIGITNFSIPSFNGYNKYFDKIGDMTIDSDFTNKQWNSLKYPYNLTFFSERIDSKNNSDIKDFIEQRSDVSRAYPNSYFIFSYDINVEKFLKDNLADEYFSDNFYVLQIK